MYLYHGTYPENIEGILKDGYIDNTKVQEDTLYVDKCIEKYLGRKLTHNATYLGADIQATRFSFDCAIPLKVGVDLDITKLFVANYNYRDEILATPEEDDEYTKVLDNYINSFISFNEYISGDLDSYDNPEYLYFDKIYIDDHLEDILIEEASFYEDEED